MKRILALVLCFLLAGCAQQSPEITDDPTAPPAADTSTQAPAEDPTAAPVDEPGGEPTTEAPVDDPTEAQIGEINETPTEAASAPVKFTLYTPNENADGFYDTVVIIDKLTAQNVLNELIKENAVSSDVVVNAEVLLGTQLLLDFNGAFRDQLLTYGTAGERMMIGSVVNTFLSAYGAESILLTVDGEILESGHVIYDFPLEFME